MSELLSATSNHLRNVEELYCGHHGWLYARLRKKLGNAMDAADLVQDTFARILASNVGVFEEPRAYLVRRAFLLSQIGGVGMLGNKDVMDTPLSVTSYTAKTLADLQTVAVADALECDPSVRSTGQTGGIVDSFFIRGFPVGEGNLGELAFDGVYGVAPNYHVFTEYAERV